MRHRRLGRGRPPDSEQARQARLRLAALGRRPAVTRASRGGWVPQAPAGLDAPAPAEPPLELPLEPPLEPPPAGGSVVLDRLPLRLRAAVGSLPHGIRGGGRMGLEGGQAVVIVLVVLLGLAVAALLMGLGRPRPEPVEPNVSATLVATGTPASGVPDSSYEGSHGDSGPAELVVHVAGKVRSPGVVRLPPGSRVLDAVEAAGGARAGVDLAGLNLARLVVDGEQVLVGVVPPAGAGAGAAPGPATGTAGPGVGPINLNTATAEQLDALPGIGPTLAERILAWRDEHRRFTSVDELQEVSGIGPKTFAELADLVTV